MKTEQQVAMYAIGGGWMFACPACAPTMTEQPDDYASAAHEWTEDDYCECCGKHISKALADAK